MNQSPTQGAGTPIDESQDANFQTPPTSPTRVRECPGAPSKVDRKRTKIDFDALNDDNYDPILQEEATESTLSLETTPAVSVDSTPEHHPARQQLIDAQRKAVAERLNQPNDTPSASSTYLISYSQITLGIAEAFKERANEGASPCSRQANQPWKPNF